MNDTDIILFEDKFHIIEIDPDVSRFVLKSDNDVNMIIDINIDIYSIKQFETLTIALARTINLKGEADDGIFHPHNYPTLLDHYEYAMHGKLFKYEQKSGQIISIYASYGGLMMNMQGNIQQLRNLVPENLSEGRLFCLIRKTD